MSRKVAAIYGSHRKKGNSSFLVDRILESVSDKNVEIRKFYLSELEIKNCRGCFFCRKAGECVIRDDMKELLDAIMEADRIILSIPIFMFQASGSVKQFLDRCYPLLQGENGAYTKRMADKDTVVVYSQGAPFAEAFREYMEINRQSLALLGFRVTDTIVCTSANEIGSAKLNAELCSQAEQIGQLF